MVIEIVGFVLDVIGKIMIGLGVYFVHRRIVKEEKIDERVFKQIRKERIFVIWGILFIILGFAMQLPAKIVGAGLT